MPRASDATANPGLKRQTWATPQRLRGCLFRGSCLAPRAARALPGSPNAVGAIMLYGYELVAFPACLADFCHIAGSVRCCLLGLWEAGGQECLPGNVTVREWLADCYESKRLNGAAGSSAVNEKRDACGRQDSSPDGRASDCRVEPCRTSRLFSAERVFCRPKPLGAHCFRRPGWSSESVRPRAAFLVARIQHRAWGRFLAQYNDARRPQEVAADVSPDRYKAARDLSSCYRSIRSRPRGDLGFFLAG